MATNKPRYTITVDEEMLKDIEEYRWRGRFESKSDATTSLVQIGINVLKAEHPEYFGSEEKPDGDGGAEKERAD